MSEKLQKVMARAGFASRREAETWIEKGRVKVNGVVAKIGDRVTDEDKIVVDGKKVAAQHKESFSTISLKIRFVRAKIQKADRRSLIACHQLNTDAG